MIGQVLLRKHLKPVESAFGPASLDRRALLSWRTEVAALKLSPFLGREMGAGGHLTSASSNVFLESRSSH